MTSPLHALAVRAGIEPTYRDAFGDEQRVADETLQALLDILAPAARSQRETRSSLFQVRARPDVAPEPPTRAWLPPALAGDGRRWGLAVQLYGLRTDRTWGVGDFSALAALVRGAAKLGAAAVGINPLHALFAGRPEHASPYSPSSRRFLNTLYLDVPAMADFVACSAAQELVARPDFQARLQQGRNARQVQYTEVAALKTQVLALLYQRFRGDCLADAHSVHARQFRQFQQEQGAELRRFATFQALAETRAEVDWRRWPMPLRNPDSPEVATFARQHTAAIEYHEYLQWQAALQLGHVAQTARECGMSIGLYTDLAVGADPAGAESWGMQALLAPGATIGAPPDILNLSGQDWGLPPLDPLALADAAHAPLASLWRSNMRCAGALRMDHIMGLMRLWWIPQDATPAQGAYVRYPWHELLALLAAQSRSSRCMVIGEDLGTVPEGLALAMHAAGILSYKLLYFEQRDGVFCAPQDYIRDALVATGTHDLPPLPMWWAGQDLDLRARLGLWPSDDEHRAARAARQRHRAGLLAALQRDGLHGAGAPDEAPVEAVYAWLARTPCRLLMVQLDDVLNVHVQANLPGTTNEHPNWRHRLPCTIKQALAHPRMQGIAHVLAAHRRSDTS